jgi:2-C-methyl-D-erythritol 2,4-cyclodiphosphate synthase
MKRVRDAGFEIGNLDATVVAEAPRLAPHLAAMRARLAALVGAPLEDVNVKLTSTDGLGFPGRKEGIAAAAVALLIRAAGETR